MTTEQTQDFVRRYIQALEDALNHPTQADYLDKVGSMLAPGFMSHTAFEGAKAGHAAIAQSVSEGAKNLSDIHYTIEAILSQDSSVMVRWRGNARFRGVAGGEARWSGMTHYLVTHNQIAEHWSYLAETADAKGGGKPVGGSIADLP